MVRAARTRGRLRPTHGTSTFPRPDRCRSRPRCRRVTSSRCTAQCHRTETRPPHTLQTTDHHRAPQTTHHANYHGLRTIQIITGYRTPSHNTADHHSPSQSITDHHRPSQTITDHHRPSQTIKDHRKPQTTQAITYLTRHHRP